MWAGLGFTGKYFGAKLQKKEKLKKFLFIRLFCFMYF